jgi:hypothetical protein
MATFSVPAIGGERPTNPVADTITVTEEATRKHNAAQPLTVVAAPSYGGDVAGRTWGNWFVESLTGSPQGLYTGVPVLFESAVSPGVRFIEHVYLKNGDTSESAVAGVSARNEFAGHRGDNMVSPMCTLIPTPRANPADPTLWSGVSLSGWGFHATAAGRVISAYGPSLPDVLPTLGGARKTVLGTYPDGPMNGPNDLCYDPAVPTIQYVADTFNHRIMKVQETSPGVVTVPQFYSGGLNKPYSLYAEADGGLIVADRENNRVVRIFGGVVTVIGTCDQPMVVRPFSDGHICVAEHGGTRRLLEMNRNTGALRTIWLIRTPQGVQNSVWIWMDVDNHGTCGPVDDIGTVDFSSYQTFHRVSRDGTTFSQFIQRGSTLAHGALGLCTDPQGHYPWAFAFSDTEAKMVFTGGGSSQIRQFRRVHVNDVTTVDAARFKRGANIWNSVADPTKPSLRLCAGLAGGHNFTGLENVETIDAMSWDDKAAWFRGGGNGSVPRVLTDAEVQDVSYWVKRYARRGLREGSVDAVGHDAPVDPTVPPDVPATVVRAVAASISVALEDIVDDPPGPDPIPDPPLPPPGEGDLDPGIWTQLLVPSRSISRPRIGGDQNIPEGDPGCAFTLSPNQSAETGTMFRSFSGMAAGVGKAWSIGGGHAGHPGNDIDILDIPTGAWTQPFQAETPPAYIAGVPNSVWRGIKGGGIATGGFSPGVRPWVHHTYRLMTVDTSRDRLLFMSGNGLGTYSTTGVWTQLTGGSKAAGEPVLNSTGGVIYDPVRDSLWAFAGDTVNGVARGIYEYTIGTDAWRFVGSFPAFAGWGFSGKTIMAMYAPQRREVFLICGVSGGSVPEFPNRLFRYSLDTGVMIWEESLKGGATGGGGTAYDELAYSDGRWNRRADVRTTTNQLYCYTPAWGTVTPGFWVFTPAATSGGTWEKLETPDGPALAWWTLCYDGQTDTFVGLRARSTYCGVAGAACGGIADTHLFTF